MIKIITTQTECEFLSQKIFSKIIFPGKKRPCIVFFFKLFIPKQLQGVTLRLAVLAPRGLTKNVLTVLSLGTCLFKSLIPFRFFSAFKCLLHRRITIQPFQISALHENRPNHTGPKGQYRQPIHASTFFKTAEPRQLSKTDASITLVSHIRRVVGA